jgi:hypothetical protein
MSLSVLHRLLYHAFTNLLACFISLSHCDSEVSEVEPMQEKLGAVWDALRVSAPDADE